METIYGEIAGSSLSTRVVGRTPDQHRILVNEIRSSPEQWFIYSLHISLTAAHTRASQLRRGHTPMPLVEFMDNIQFKSVRDERHGPVVLVRWHITESPPPARP